MGKALKYRSGNEMPLWRLSASFDATTARAKAEGVRKAAPTSHPTVPFDGVRWRAEAEEVQEAARLCFVA